MNSTNCLYFSVRPFGITDFVRWSSSLAISLNASLTIATIISNAAVILTVVRFRELRTSSHLLIAFLALTDVSIGLFVQPLFIAFEILTLTRTTPACVVIVLYTVLRALFATMSQVTVLLISMEKTLAIFWPFRYRQIVRQRRIFITMAIVWCVWILVVSARFMGLETKTFRITVGVVIITCHALTGLAYVRIERLAAGHMKKIKQQLQSVSENNASWKAQDSRAVCAICRCFVEWYRSGCQSKTR
ncbi:beta-3 adrenergic receptor [Nematostella vectensis]|uniref:beta-3 adrenergic receptor n=1 Tax=Nematostella vectensis TaxID=45351 RepID=UPI00138FC387|nr:beta-3 adrenergic receptor [Nematostella vectensis]